MKSVKSFKSKKITGIRDVVGGAQTTTQAWDGGNDRRRNDGSFKTNVDWNPFNNDQV